MNLKTSELDQLLEAIEEQELSISEAVDIIRGNNKKQQSQPGNEETELVVDYSQSVRQMKERGNYKWKSCNITEEHFPFPAELSGKKIHVPIRLLNFESIDGKNAVKGIYEAGYDPGNLAELLALGQTFPDWQREFPIIALGSIWSHHVPCLSVDIFNRRVLQLLNFEDWFSFTSRFLAVRTL